MRVIHLPTSTGGNPQGVSRHLQELGVQSETWVMNRNLYDYPVDKVLTDPDDSLLVREVKRLLGLRYVAQCDVVFYNYGTSLFQPFPVVKGTPKGFFQKLKYFVYSVYLRTTPRLEQLLVRAFRRRVFLMYQGDDARQGDFCKSNFRITFADKVGDQYYTFQTDEAKRKRIRYFEKYAERIYALNPDLLHVLPGRAEFLPYSHINLSDWSPSYPTLEQRPLRIGHAPSHRGVKGTDLVLKAIDELKRLGFRFEFTLVEGVRNQALKESLQQQDVIVDQLYAGWYGGLAVEAMALGKPVIAYIRSEDLCFIPEGMRLQIPILQTEPASIFDTLKHVLQMPRLQLIELAKASRKYVETWHDPYAIAARIKRDIEHSINSRFLGR